MSPAKSKYPSRRVGSVRPSQMIHTYGPGAVMDLPQLSVVLSGIDGWDLNHTERILEARLIPAVRQVSGCHQVEEFRMPPWEEETSSPFDQWAGVGIPVHPFPRWLRCTKCHLLSTVDRKRFTLDVNPFRPDKARYFHDRCTGRGRGPTAVPTRFLIACPAGHLDDFPWEEYAHRGNPCPADAQVLELRDVGRATRATNMKVICKTCNAQRNVLEAFRPDADRSLPACRGRHPHLQRFDGSCPQPTRALLLGASNSWFPVYRSALTIPTVTGEIDTKVAEYWDYLEDLENRTELEFILKRLKKGIGEKPLRWLIEYDMEDVWAAIIDRRNSNEGEDTDGADELRGPEWEAFTAVEPPESDHFKTRILTIPSGFRRNLDNPVAVDRLREVMALCGFTRIDGPDASDQVRIAPIWKKPQRWLPAAELRGEGILIRLREWRVERWEQNYRASPRYAQMLDATRQWRSRRGLDPDLGAPPARFVLLHTLSHLLIHQVALECGYSTASIRERLYCRESEDTSGPPMAGVLLYTASPDSEGTLGGLVAVSQPERLARLLRKALDPAKLCSTDPMCADHRAGDLSDTLHNAACHACLFAPETSCEVGNRYLDRAAAVPILGHRSDAYFA